MIGLRVLITNNSLAARGGSETYVRDIALGLLQRGHQPLLYSTNLGAVAVELQSADIPVVNNLSQVSEAPEVIHGHHHMETMTALLHFPHVPAINFCHSSINWLEAPIRFPRVLRYVAVDHACRDRLLQLHHIPAEQIRVVLNSVDLNRFPIRKKPLPSRPARALLFSNYANRETHLTVVREACRRTNLELDVVGSGEGNATTLPEQILGKYDLVFAKARCAIEAMAVGAAVILCDAGGVGSMVTAAEIDRLRPLNFGIRTLQHPLDPGIIVQEINRYDSADAAEVSRLIRANAGLASMVDELVELYAEVIEEYCNRDGDSVAEEGRAAAAYLRQLKIDFAVHGAASMRLREQVAKIPGLGRWLVKLTQKIITPSE